MFKFLNNFYDETYIPHVRHIIYPCLIIAAGFVSIIKYQWITFGVIYVILGILLFIVISIGIGWRGPIEYWDKIAEAIKALLRAGVQPIEIKKILGLSTVDLPETITIKEYVEKDGVNALPGIRYTHLQASDA